MHVLAAIDADATFKLRVGIANHINQDVSMTTKVLVVELEPHEEALLFTEGEKGSKLMHASLVL